MAAISGTSSRRRSGDQAALMSFTLELMGARDVRNYYHGWAEWGNSPDTPVVSHPAKR